MSDSNLLGNAKRGADASGLFPGERVAPGGDVAALWHEINNLKSSLFFASQEQAKSVEVGMRRDVFMALLSHGLSACEPKRVEVMVRYIMDGPLPSEPTKD